MRRSLGAALQAVTVAASLMLAASGAYAVDTQPRKPPCAVLEKGFTAVPGADGWDVSVGFVVRADEHVQSNVSVLVNFRDSAGRIFATLVGESIWVLPKGQKVPYGMEETDEGRFSVPRRPVTISVVVSCQRAGVAQPKLPRGRVTATSSRAERIDFQVPMRNTSRDVWRYGTEIGFVVRERGRIVGGGVGQTYADLPPKRAMLQDVWAEPIAGDGPYSIEYVIVPAVY